MSYIDKHLLTNERVLFRTSIHWTVYFSWKALLSLGLWAWIKRKSTECAITNKRLVMRTGLIDRKTLELNLVKVESLAVDQSLFGRLFNYGNVVVHGTGGTNEVFPHIGDPLGLRRALQEAIDGGPH